MRTKKERTTPVEKMTQLEVYLRTCPGKCDVNKFDSTDEAYSFGQKIIENCMKEEGVFVRDKLQKYHIDISYDTVRIKLIVEELVSC